MSGRLHGTSVLWDIESHKNLLFIFSVSSFIFCFVFVFLSSLCCQLFWECIVAEVRIKHLKVCKCNTDADIKKT